MGKVLFTQFRNTQYYSVKIIKDAEKERFWSEQSLRVDTVSEILSNWRSTGMTKRINGNWYVNQYICFNTQHELRHQNYSISQIDCL